MAQSPIEKIERLLDDTQFDAASQVFRLEELKAQLRIADALEAISHWIEELALSHCAKF